MENRVERIRYLIEQIKSMNVTIKSHAANLSRSIDDVKEDSCTVCDNSDSDNLKRYENINCLELHNNYSFKTIRHQKELIAELSDLINRTIFEN